MKSKGKRPKSKIRLGVIFGGRSVEHQVSIVSADSIIKALDKDKYDIIPIGITQDGKWLSSENVLEVFKEGRGFNNISEKILLPDPTRKGLVEINSETGISQIIPFDVIFPVLHGTYGEDGTIQGLFELANIPYVGAGVLGSAVGMDKVVTKQLCEHAGIPVVPYVCFLIKNYRKKRWWYVAEVEKRIGYPCFIKPVNLGSSIGISKAYTRKELLAAINLAGRYDRKILVEKSIDCAREIEVGVLGHNEPIASVPGEVISSNEFYDYNAKYVDGKSETVIPAKLPKVIVDKLKEYAVLSFKVIDCSGMARVDFLLDGKTNKIYFNEINTIPGFTSISMYAQLWKASGISYSKLLDRLIGFAIEKFNEKKSLKITYKPKSKWYKQ